MYRMVSLFQGLMMSFEPIDGSGPNPLDDLDLFGDGPEQFAESVEATAIINSDPQQIVSDVVSDMSIGDKIITRLTDVAENLESRSPSRGGKDVLYFDIETAPDWSRFDSFGLEKPDVAENETPDLMMPAAAEAVSLTVDKLKELIARQNPTVEWLDHVAAEEAKGKGRKGILDVVKAAKEAKDKYGQFIKKLSVNPMYCRVVALGHAMGSDDPAGMICISEESEKIALERFWCAAKAADLICGFNIRGFDLRVILVRSMIHGISPSIEIDLRKYGSSNVLDLMGVLYDWDISRTIGLKQTCELLGIPVGNDCDGSQVNDLVENPTDENLSKLVDYCRNDVKLVQRLHRERLAGYFCV